jgi:predicted porin
LEKLSMKKSLIALAALAVVSAASAQSTVSLTGGVEIGLYKAVGKTAVVGTDRGSFTNITFAATEDLGGGLKASFMAQMRMNPADGGSSSTKYGYPFEQVKTSLSGGFGSVDLGKFSTAAQAGWIRLFGDDGSLGAYSASPTTRAANQIAYNTPAISGFKAQIVKIQGDSASPATNNDGTQVTGMYDANKVQAYVTISSKINGVTALTAGTVGTAGNNVSGAPAFTGPQTDAKEYGVAYDFGMARVALGQTTTELSAGGTKTKETALGLQVPINAALSLGLGYGKFSEGTNDGQKKVALSAMYSLSKRTTLLAKYLDVSGNAIAASNGSGSFLGLSHTF